MFRILTAVPFLFVLTAPAQVTPIELTPLDVASSSDAIFSALPTVNPEVYLGPIADGADVRAVGFNTAPTGPLAEGQSLTTEYASLGVLMNDIRISAVIYGGNEYGPGFAAEDDAPQVYTFTERVVAVGIVNTSPDGDLVQFYSGPDATGTLLFEFNDQVGTTRNFNIDRFVGGVAEPGTSIGSFRVSNQSGNLELDELIFVVESCLADTNGDGAVDPADFNAWILAFNTQSPSCDQNGDGLCDPSDFNAWILNYNAGCP